MCVAEGRWLRRRCCCAVAPHHHTTTRVKPGSDPAEHSTHTMALKLYTFPGNPRANKALIAAKYNVGPIQQRSKLRLPCRVLR
eukprot:COSAG04_NODE_3523_length_2741_cov_2.752839_1_plen_83_part_00